jgi:methylglutaconyl-CoA hydratase
MSQSAAVPPTDGFVGVATTEGVATVSFGHPKSNALPGQLLMQMAATFDDFADRPDVRVVLLQSIGTGAFCAGASFDELLAVRTEQQGKSFFSGFAHLILAMRRCPKPIVTRVQGKAAGGGVGIIAASDYVIATPNASIRLSELALGIGPFVVGPVIERRVGSGAFAAMSLDAEWRDAAWAERHGLYARVVDNSAALDQASAALATRLATSNPEATSELKQIFWEGTESWESLLFERAAISGRLVLSEFARHAIEAFRKS